MLDTQKWQTYELASSSALNGHCTVHVFGSGQSVNANPSRHPHSFETVIVRHWGIYKSPACVHTIRPLSATYFCHNSNSLAIYMEHLGIYGGSWCNFNLEALYFVQIQMHDLAMLMKIYIFFGTIALICTCLKSVNLCFNS